MSEDNGFMSLAQMAQLDTDSIEALSSRSYEAGIYSLVGKAIAVTERAAKEEGQPPLFNIGLTYECVGFEPADKKVDAEKMIGRDIKESITLWPKDFAEGIGLVKGRYVKAGIQCTGLPMGGVAGQDPGWLDLMIGSPITVRIGTYKDQQGETRNNFNWMKPKAPVDQVE